MAATPAVLLRHLRRLASQHHTDAASDPALLEGFVRCRDEAAFAALVARHGPLVLRVCRRVLADPHAAEDAFQATFLVLARRAGTIRRRQRLVGWLHGVAYRVALKARTAEALRQGREAPSADLAPPDPRPDPLAELTARELLCVLDEEVQRLPEVYRLPVLLCCLEGHTQEEAARRLGWTAGSIRGRLERGRARLRDRLARRGLTLPAALAIVGIGQSAAAMQPTLAGATVRAAVAFAAAGGASAGAISARVVALAEGGLESMAAVKLKVGAALLLLTGVFVGGAGLAAYQARTKPEALAQKAVPTAARGANQPKPEPEKPLRTDLHGDPLPEGAIARIGTARLRTDGYVNVVVFAPDGRRLAYGSEHGFVHVCEAADGKPLFDLRPDETRPLPVVTELAFSPDGRTLAVGGYWCRAVWLFDLATGKVRGTVPNTVEGHDRWARREQGPGFAFTPDGRTLVVGGKDGALHLWDAATRTEQAALAGANGFVASLTLTADGRTALTAHSGGELHLWDVANRKHLRKLAAPAKRPHQAVLAPDGKTIALVAGDSELELWEPDGGRRHQVRTAALVVGLGFTPDGASLQVADGDGNVTVWDARTGQKRSSLTCEGISRKGDDDRAGRKPWAWFRPDGKAMAWAVVGVIRPWDLTTGQESPRLTWYRQGVGWAGFSADGRLLRAAGATGELGVWDAATGRPHGPPRTIDSSWGARYATASDRKRVVAVTPGDIVRNPKPGEGRIFLWDPAGEVGPVPLRGQVGPAWYAALTPDNRFVVATEATGQIRVYEAATGKLARSFDGRKAEYNPTFSPDGALLATTASEWTIRLYDFATGRLLRELKGLTHAGCLAFSPDGRLLASGHSTDPRPGEQLQPVQPGDIIYLWDTASGRELRRIPTGHHRVQALSFSPNGRLIASGGLDGVVRLWEAASGQERRRYDGHRSWVQSVDFDPNGRRLASASLDGTALVWQVFDPAPANRPAADLDALWADLTKDGAAAHRAMAALIAARGTAAFLSGRVKPAVKPSDDQLKAWLTDLGSPAFETREAAHKEIARASELIEPALQRAREAATDAEVRRRLSALLENLPLPETRPEYLRDLRAVEVLEQAGTPEARRLLEPLTQGAPEARLTREAKAALQRLAKPPGTTP